MSFDEIQEWLTKRESQNLYRRRRVLESPQGIEVFVEGKRFLNFCSNDYLGLADDDRLKEAFKKGVDRWGVGSGASHLVSGHMGVHHELEELLADFVGRPSAVLFSTGYAANMGTINSLLSDGDQVFQDRLNHASLLDGGWISRAEFNWFDHSNLSDLAEKVSVEGQSGSRQLVVSDGTFSMDGDFCKIRALVDISRKKGLWVMIDDAHGIGTHGRGGVGLVDPVKFTTTDIPVLVGTLDKAFGSFGDFVAGEKSLTELLVQKARSYIYSTAIPPAIAAATIKSVEIVREEQWRRDHLDKIIEYFRSEASGIGFDIVDSMSPIQPLLVGDPREAIRLSSHLEREGILISAIRPPTVPDGTSRLRITLTAGHSFEHIEKLLDGLRNAKHVIG